MLHAHAPVLTLAIAATQEKAARGLSSMQGKPAGSLWACSALRGLLCSIFCGASGAWGADLVWHKPCGRRSQETQPPQES